MEQNNGSLVTVIVPVYNGAGYITETLRSVKEQTYKLWECIIVNDGSTDDTAVVVKQFIASDDRFVYLDQPNKGLSGARNAGLEHAKGNFIQFLDADDVLLPLKIEKQMTHLLQNNDPMTVSYTDYVSGTSADISREFDFYKSAQFNSTDYCLELIMRWESSLVIPPHCFLFNSYFFRGKGIRFDTSLPNHEDFDCWLNIFRLEPRVWYLNEKLCVYRITDNSMSKKMKLMGEGFLEVLNKQVQTPHQPKLLREQLIRKRREVLKRYNRFDRMTWKERILSIGYILAYYRKRIFQKAGLLS
jgi:glycosyltransferase involved in cell wall biosynthesis